MPGDLKKKANSVPQASSPSVEEQNRLLTQGFPVEPELQRKVGEKGGLASPGGLMSIWNRLPSRPLASLPLSGLPLAGLLFALLLTPACQPPAESPETSLESEPELVADPYLTVGTATSADGLSVAYSTRGGGATTLVFIHGWSCDRTYWSEQIDDLARDYRVVTLDLGGHGDSGEDRQEWTFASLAEDVRAVVEHLDLQRVVLVGHSMGGPVGLLAAAMLPSRVVGMVGVDTLHDVTFEFPPEVWQQLLASYDKDFKGTCGEMVRSMASPTAEPGFMEQIEADMCSAPPTIAVALFSRFGDFDFSAAMAAVQVPITVINAATNPTNLVANREVSPQFEAIIMEQVGHFLMMEQPEEFNQHLRKVLEGWEQGDPVPPEG